MIDQLSFLGKEFCTEEEIADLKRQMKNYREYEKKKRRWENAFQKWSNEHGIEGDGTESWGCCGYGAMCDWCKDNDYGRPCVRALNAMLREKGETIDYDDMDFTKVW